MQKLKSATSIVALALFMVTMVTAIPTPAHAGLVLSESTAPPLPWYATAWFTAKGWFSN